MKIVMYVAFVLSGIFSLTAVAAEMTGVERSVTIAAVVIAFISLAIGFACLYAMREPEPIVLGEDRQEIIREKKALGDFSGAVAQIRMWYPQATPDEAGKIVRELK